MRSPRPNSHAGILTGMGNGSRTWETCCLQQHTKGADGEKQPRASRKPAVSPPDQPKGAEPHIPSGSTPGMTRETAGGMYARQSGGDAIQSATAVCRLKTRATGDRGRTVPTGVRRSPYKAGEEVRAEDPRSICRGMTRTARKPTGIWTRRLRNAA